MKRAGEGRMEVAGSYVELWPGEPGNPERPLLNHLGVLVQSADEWRARAEAAGVEVADIVDAPNTYAVFVWGPERVKLEYVEHKPASRWSDSHRRRGRHGRPGRRQPLAATRPAGDRAREGYAARRVDAPVQRRDLAPPHAGGLSCRVPRRRCRSAGTDRRPVGRPARLARVAGGACRRPRDGEPAGGRTAG